MKKLERRLGLSAVVSISVSAMLGSGIFVLPGIAATNTGASVWLAYVLASLSVLPAALSKSELATAMPTSGGTYVYLERTFGPLVGTISGLGLWVSLLLKATFALMGFGAYLKILAPQVQLVPTSLSILAFICVLNILGVGKVSGLLMVVVGLCIGLLTLISGASIFTFDASLMDPLFPSGLSGLASATALVFVSYAGVTKVAAIAEEIKEPERNLPRGILISLFIVTLVYSGVTFLLFGNLPYADLANNLRPIYSLAVHVQGPLLGSITAVVAVLTMSSMANSGLLAASRFPFAMARDSLLPSRFGRLNRRYLTPVWSIIISGLLMAFVLLNLDVAKIAKFASAFMLLIYMAENIAVVVLREARVQWYKPTYNSPFYPFVQIIGIALNTILLSYMGFDLIVPAFLSIGIPGLIIFLLYSRRKTSRRGVLGIRGKRQDLVVGKQEIIPRSQLVEDIDLSVDANVVVALFGKERSAEMLIEMGVAMAKEKNCEIAHITEAPEQTDLNDLIYEPAELRSLRRRVLAMAVERKEPITFEPVVSHDLARTVFHISQRLHCQWLFIEWRGKTAGAFTIHNPISWLKGHLRCNLGIFRDAGVRHIRKVLCYLKGDDSDTFVLSTADHFAEANKADITLLRVLPPNAPEDLEQRIERDLNELAKECVSRSTVNLIKSEKPIEAIITQTVEYDLFIFGGSKHKFWTNLFGSQDDKLMAKAACSVLSVQSAPESSENDIVQDYFN